MLENLKNLYKRKPHNYQHHKDVFNNKIEIGDVCLINKNSIFTVGYVYSITERSIVTSCKKIVGWKNGLYVTRIMYKSIEDTDKILAEHNAIFAHPYWQGNIINLTKLNLYNETT